MGTRTDDAAERRRSEEERETLHRNEDLLGKVAGLAARLEDALSEVREKERRLEESEERFRITFEKAAVGMAHVAPNGRWLRINARLCQIVGYEKEELMGLTFQDITHPDDLDTDLCYVEKMLEGRLKTYSMEKRYLKKDGSRVWICLSVTLVRSASSMPEYFISVVDDVTERKIAELVPEPLTETETKVLRLIAEGRTNKRIAEKLAYSAASIKLNVQRILAKLGARGRKEAARRAIEIGLLTPPPPARKKRQKASGSDKGKGETASVS